MSRTTTIDETHVGVGFAASVILTTLASVLGLMVWEFAPLMVILGAVWSLGVCSGGRRVFVGAVLGLALVLLIDIGALLIVVARTYE